MSSIILTHPCLSCGSVIRLDDDAIIIQTAGDVHVCEGCKTFAAERAEELGLRVVRDSRERSKGESTRRVGGWPTADEI